MLLHPCAILANGPPWIIAGVCSKVWTKFGLIASLSNTVNAPSAFKSCAVIAFPSLLNPIIIFPSLLLNLLSLDD